tara:strand:- start:668 stop:1177 length:510 start_codon:yes stop_codon:yes gene_type:complete
MEQADDVVPFDAPIAGMSLTHELGARPWQSPSQYSTVEEALDYYIPRLQTEEVKEQLLDVLEMGVPVTNIANAMQTAGVMQGKHSIDVGMLVLPVLVELIMLIGDAADIEYTSGLEKGKRIRSTLVDNAVERLKEKEKTAEVKDVVEEEEEIVEEMPEERAGGLMSRSV